MRIQSAKSNKRRLYNWSKRLILGIMGISVLAGVYFLLKQQLSQPAGLEAQTPSAPIERIHYKTDGQLSDRWLQSFLALAPNTGMMEVDIFELKKNLEAQPQILRAELERNFPNELRVQLFEQSPVLRLVTMDKRGRKELKLVSKTGHIFTPIDYPIQVLKKLPFVRPYKNSQGQFFPMCGMDRIAEILKTFEEKVPTLSRQIKVVSLEHFSGDARVPGEVIHFQTTYIPTIVMGAHQALGVQLDRLNFILKHIADRGNPAIARIDLSLSSAAAVKLKSGQLSAYH